MGKVAVRLSADSFKRRFMQLIYCERMGGETIKLVSGLSFSPNVTLSLTFTFQKIRETKDRSLLICAPLTL